MKIAGLLVGFCLLMAHPAWAETPADVRVIPMQNPQQPFEVAAKLQWNPHDGRWEKVLVVYNGHEIPPETHPVWAYLRGLALPDRPPRQAGENLSYKAFHSDAFCSGTTPLTAGKPMSISFEQDSVGAYAQKDFFRDWNCPGWNMGLNNVSVVDGAGSRTGDGKGLRVNLLKGRSGCPENGGACANWKPHLGAQLDTLTYSYWVKFPDNFDFVLGGKLPGIGSNNARTGGVKPNGRDGWSVRVMWDKSGALGQYVYHVDQRINFGDFFMWDAPPVERGKWYQIKTQVRLNTAGQSNGAITTWLNGKQVLDKRDLRFQLGDDLKIERFLFSVFFGGSGAQWAPRTDQQVYLDDFVLTP